MEGTESVFGQSFARDPAGGAHDVPQTQTDSVTDNAIHCAWKQIQVIFVVVGLLCDCRPVPQITLILGGKKFPLDGIFTAQLQF